MLRDGAVDTQAAWEGISRDMSELTADPALGYPFLALLFALPLASLALVAMGHKIALGPLLVTPALVAFWFLHYATEWWGPVSGGIVIGEFFLVALGWAVLAAAVLNDGMRPQRNSRQT